MTRLSRYISTTITSSILMVLLVIVGLDAIADIIDETSKLDGRYDFPAALKFVLFSIPGNIFELLPFAALVGCLAGLGGLASNSELIVIRSAGVSTTRIVWLVMRPALMIMVVGMMVSEYIAPGTESVAQSARAAALRKTDNEVSKEDLWHREGNQFMHFNVVQPNGVLYGVIIYEFDDDRRLLGTLFAERAIFQANHWLLEDVVENRIYETHTERVSVRSKPWKTELSSNLLNILVLDPLDLSVLELWRYANYLDSQNLNSGPYRLAFWEKVLQPLSTLALVLVAISIVFGPLREVTMGFRIFVGVLIGIVFRTAQDMLGPASLVYGFQPIYASLLPVLVGVVFGVWFLRRAN